MHFMRVCGAFRLAQARPRIGISQQLQRALDTALERRRLKKRGELTRSPFTHEHVAGNVLADAARLIDHSERARRGTRRCAVLGVLREHVGDVEEEGAGRDQHAGQLVADLDEVVDPAPTRPRFQRCRATEIGEAGIEGRALTKRIQLKTQLRHARSR